MFFDPVPKNMILSKEENKIEVFNYKKYIKTIHTLHFGNMFQIAESNQTYNFIKKEKNIDLLDFEGIIREVLSDKNEVVNFINDFLYPKENINVNVLKRSISKRIKDKKDQLIYKIYSKQIYYIIELQRAENDEIAVSKLLNCCIEIMSYAIKKGRFKQNITYPIIYPVIICLQEESKSGIKMHQRQNELSTISEVEFTYNIIKIKKLSDEKLLSKNTLINKALLAIKNKNIKLLQEVIDLTQKANTL